MFSFRKTEIIRQENRFAVVSGFINRFSGRTYTFCFGFSRESISPRFHDQAIEIQALPYGQAIELAAVSCPAEMREPRRFGRSR